MWQETVITRLRLWSILGDEKEKGDHSIIKVLERVRDEQAEISFKAGMQKVVEELTFYNEGITLAQLGATNRWQAFLKEKGLNE